MLQTCNRCRQRRTKCDALVPACANCARVNLECVVHDEVLQRDIRRSYIKSLQDRVDELKTRLELQQLHADRQGALGQSTLATTQIFRDQSNHHLITRGRECLYLGLSPPALVAIAAVQALDIKLEINELNSTTTDNFDSIDLTGFDRSAISPNIMRRLLACYDRSFRPVYPIPGAELTLGLEASFKKLPNVQKFKLLIACAIAATHEGYRKPEWNVVAKVCREWADELVNPIIALWDRDAVIAILLLIIYEQFDDSRGIIWDLLDLAIRMCLQLGWHRRKRILEIGTRRNTVDGSTQEPLSESVKEEMISVLKSIERPLRMIFGRPSMLTPATFPTTTYDDSTFETYTKLSQELYISRGNYATYSCPLAGLSLSLMKSLESLPNHNPTVQECWLLFLPLCVDHEPCATCSMEVGGTITNCMSSLREKLLESAQLLVALSHAKITSADGFIPPLVASYLAFTAGCTMLIAVKKGWTKSDFCMNALLHCSEILTFAAPHWRGGQEYLDVWRSVTRVAH